MICSWQEELLPGPASLSTRISVHEQMKYPSVDVGIDVGGGVLRFSDEWESNHSVKALLLILNKCRDLVTHSSIVVPFFNSNSSLNAVMIKMLPVPRDRAGGCLHLMLWSSDRSCASCFKDNNFHGD